MDGLVRPRTQTRILGTRAGGFGDTCVATVWLISDDAIGMIRQVQTGNDDIACTVQIQYLRGTFGTPEFGWCYATAVPAGAHDPGRIARGAGRDCLRNAGIGIAAVADVVAPLRDGTRAPADHVGAGINHQGISTLDHRWIGLIA